MLELHTQVLRPPTSSMTHVATTALRVQDHRSATCEHVSTSIPRPVYVSALYRRNLHTPVARTRQPHLPALALRQRTSSKVRPRTFRRVSPRTSSTPHPPQKWRALCGHHINDASAPGSVAPRSPPSRPYTTRLATARTRRANSCAQTAPAPLETRPRQKDTNAVLASS